MIDLPELLILDIGHGNCAILQDADTVTVIDCPPSATVVEVLERQGIDTVDNILISHSDVDHAGGLPNLLKKVFVRNVYVNPDADKRGARGNLWKGIRIALGLAEEKGTVVHPSLTTSLSKKINSDQVAIEILSPSSIIALGGVGGDDLDGRTQSSNSMSVVIGLVHDSCRVALLPGDMDENGLDNLLKKQQNIEAQILVFPHHGGTPGNNVDCREFATKLCRHVQPNLVVFSHGRNRYQNPRKDIMQGVLLAAPNAHVMCTQLSKKCGVTSPLSDFSHLTNLPAAGFVSDSCCGGTIVVEINGKQTMYMPSLSEHRSFVTNKMKVPTPLCLYKLAAQYNNKQDTITDAPTRASL
jgi:competence protein ComEC